MGSLMTADQWRIIVLLMTEGLSMTAETTTCGGLMSRSQRTGLMTEGLMSPDITQDQERVINMRKVPDTVGMIDLQGDIEIEITGGMIERHETITTVMSTRMIISIVKIVTMMTGLP